MTNPHNNFSVFSTVIVGLLIIAIFAGWASKPKSSSEATLNRLKKTVAQKQRYATAKENQESSLEAYNLAIQKVERRLTKTLSPEEDRNLTEKIEYLTNSQNHVEAMQVYETYFEKME